MKPTPSDWSADALVRERRDELSRLAHWSEGARASARFNVRPREVQGMSDAIGVRTLKRRERRAPLALIACAAAATGLRLRTWASALLCAWLLGGVAEAAIFEAVNTSLTAGGRQTVGTFVVNGSIGGIGGSASVGTVLARHGVAGQFTDLQSVTVSASPASLNEGTTRQLTATAVFTDATTLPLAATAVTWSATGGGLASVSTAGLATAATVYQNTNGIARADYLGQFGTLTLAVANVNTDDFSTYASDGLDDAWQVTHFGLASANGAATADPDGDGQNNLLEFLAGTTPTSSASVFGLSISAVGTGQRTVSFSPVTAGRTYTVEYATSLTSRNFTPLSGTPVDNAGTRSLTDTSTANSARFYRVRISLP